MNLFPALTIPPIRLMQDIPLALMAVRTQTMEVPDAFPTIPAVWEAEQILAEAENPEVTIPKAPCRNTFIPPVTN